MEEEEQGSDLGMFYVISQLGQKDQQPGVFSKFSSLKPYYTWSVGLSYYNGEKTQEA